MKIKEILTAIEYLDFVGDESGEVSELLPLDAKPHATALFWCNESGGDMAAGIGKGTIVCGEFFTPELMRKGVNYIVVKNPRRSFQRIAQKFFSPYEPAGISPHAVIDPSAKLGANVTIGAHVVIEKDCEIGADSVIGHNTVIRARTKIGRHVWIGCNNTIGGLGFGYEKDEEGNFQVIPHMGNVIIGDHVDIGNNTSIDRAVLGSTRIEHNAKIDNLVHIAHGVTIGANTLVIAHAMIGGNTRIGENAWIAPGATILNKISVGEGSVVGMGSVVIKPVPEKTVVAGSPARVLRTIGD